MPRAGEKVAFVAVAASAGFLLLNLYRKQRQQSTKYSVPPELLSSNYSKELQVAVALALESGRSMYLYYDSKGTAAEIQHDLNIVTKGRPEDFFTQIDLDNEKLIMEGILAAFPDHSIIGEETVGQGTIPKLTEAPTWIIDPIDGTTNFAAGLPLSCVSIGLCIDQKPVLGVVYAPATDELYLAVYARDNDAAVKMTSVVRRILRNGCRCTRSLGSGVLDLCYVAAGKLDVGE